VNLVNTDGTDIIILIDDIPGAGDGEDD